MRGPLLCSAPGPCALVLSTHSSLARRHAPVGAAAERGAAADAADQPAGAAVREGPAGARHEPWRGAGGPGAAPAAPEPGLGGRLGGLLGLGLLLELGAGAWSGCCWLSSSCRGAGCGRADAGSAAASIVCGSMCSRSSSLAPCALWLPALLLTACCWPGGPLAGGAPQRLHAACAPARLALPGQPVAGPAAGPGPGAAVRQAVQAAGEHGGGWRWPWLPARLASATAAACPAAQLRASQQQQQRPPPRPPPARRSSATGRRST